MLSPEAKLLLGFDKRVGMIWQELLAGKKEKQELSEMLLKVLSEEGRKSGGKL